MSKVLLISGSPRKGNTEFVLQTLFNLIKSDKELLLLRNKDIKRCMGCLHCHDGKKCVIQDDMQEIYQKMLKADIFVVGTPNYFDNVSGLVKDFIDRSNPFYETDKLKGKKVITIVTGGGKIENSKRVGEQALKYFWEGHNLNLIGDYYFQALKGDELENNPESVKTIGEIIEKINSL